MTTVFFTWLNKKYGKHGKVKATRGKQHDYLGMTIDFSTKGKVVIDMCDYIRKGYLFANVQGHPHYNCSPMH